MQKNLTNEDGILKKEKRKAKHINMDGVESKRKKLDTPTENLKKKKASKKKKKKKKKSKKKCKTEGERKVEKNESVGEKGERKEKVVISSSSICKSTPLTGGQTLNQDVGNVSNKIYCSNFGAKMEEKDIMDFFKGGGIDVGSITSTYWLYNKKTDEFRGCGFVTFKSKQFAIQAVTELRGKECKGNVINISYARPMESWNNKKHSGKSKSVFLANLPSSITEEILNEFFEENKIESMTSIVWVSDKETGHFKGQAFVSFKHSWCADNAVKLDGSEICSQEISIRSTTSRQVKRAKFLQEQEALGLTPKHKEAISAKPAGCTTAFIGNLSYSITEDEILSLAKESGEVASIRWVTDRSSGEFKGCGFCEFKETSSVENFVKLNGKHVKGRPIRIDYAPDRSDH